MRIAVIGGEYDADSYKDFLSIVKIARPEEYVIDMSRHQEGENWKKDYDKRCQDINSAHQVIIPSDWRDHINAKRDITYAEMLRKELFIYINGTFYPWEDYCAKR